MKRGEYLNCKKKGDRDCIILSLYKTNDLSETQKWKRKKSLIFMCGLFYDYSMVQIKTV